MGRNWFVLNRADKIAFAAVNKEPHKIYDFERTES
jgi:hypothetical protein